MTWSLERGIHRLAPVPLVRTATLVGESIVLNHLVTAKLAARQLAWLSRYLMAILTPSASIRICSYARGK